MDEYAGEKKCLRFAPILKALGEFHFFICHNHIIFGELCISFYVDC